MINSHLLYRLSYRGTTTRILLIKKESQAPGLSFSCFHSTWVMARVTLSRLPLFSAATQMRPVLTA